MTGLKWFLTFAVAFYIGLTALMYLFQRALMYFPETLRTRPAQAGLPEAQEVTLATDDGERLIAWYVPPDDGKPVILYFQGNGGSPRYRAARFRAIVAEGNGLLALAYRGYGGSTGSPTEPGLLADAQAAYDFAASHYPAARIALWGESLGGALAVALAGEREVGGVILEAPFTSAADVAKRAYPIFPVRWLMHDQFRSDERIGRVKAPVLVMHGEHDEVVAFSLGERLYGLITAPKRFVRFPRGRHNDLSDHGAEATALKFLAEKME